MRLRICRKHPWAEFSAYTLSLCALIPILASPRTVYLCTDINPHANNATYRTGIQNNVIESAVHAHHMLIFKQVPLEPIRTSLVDSLQVCLERKVDLLLFNPPYVPTEELESTDAQVAQGIEGAWAGGSDGMDITDSVLVQADVRTLQYKIRRL